MVPSNLKDPTRTFRDGWCAEAARWEPQTIAGSPEQLLELASRDDRPELTHAVIVLERQSDGLLTEADRERLWRAFGVPIFEQVLGEKGELLASECEAHCGLHIQVTEFAVDIDTDRDSRRFVVETARCACGRENPRLVVKDPSESISFEPTSSEPTSRESPALCTSERVAMPGSFAHGAGR